MLKIGPFSDGKVGIILQGIVSQFSKIQTVLTAFFALANDRSA